MSQVSLGSRASWVKWIFIVFAAFILLFKSCYTVAPGEYGIHLRFGAIIAVNGNGMYFKIPFADGINYMNSTIQKVTVDGEASSKDLQAIQTTLAVNFKLKDEKVSEIYRTIGTLDQVEDKLVIPSIHEVFKSVTAGFKSEELINRREEVSRRILENMQEKLGSYNIEIKGINIVNFNFSKEFAISVEEKLVAEQKALKAANDLDRIRKEAEQRIVAAEGDAKAQQLQRSTLSEDLLRLKFIEKWDGKMPVVVGAGGSLFDLSKIMDSRR